MLSLLLAGLASPTAAEVTAEAKESAAQEWHLGLSQSGGGALGRGLFGRFSGDPAPWAVASPGAAGARFGLGLDTFFEHEESLRISSMESSITVRDLVSGREESGVLHGDPGLLNRKFDIVWEMKGAGGEVPIALTRLGKFAYSTLVLQAATADVTLDFLDRTQAQDSSSLGGRGTLLGTELKVVTAPSPSRPWFIESSYRFQKIPSFTVDRSPRFGPEGFEVLDDEVRLGREVQEFAIRSGYGFSGNRVMAYTGVLHRRTDLELEDGLRYRDPLRATETHLASRTKLKSEATLVLAGVDYGLGPRLFSRLETSVGEGDWGVILKVVHTVRSESTEKDIDAFGVSVAPLLAQIEVDFRKRREALTVVSAGPEGTAYLAAEIALLLDSTETRLLEVLDLEELAPVRGSIEFRFRRFRRDLGLIPPVARRGQVNAEARTGIALATYKQAQSRPDRILYADMAHQILDDIGALLLRATGLARAGNLTLKLCVDSLPSKAKFRLWFPKLKGPEGKTAKTVSASRGMYYYKLWFTNDRLRPIECSKPADEPCLDLWESNGDQLVKCDFDTGDCDPSPLPSQGCP